MLSSWDVRSIPELMVSGAAVLHESIQVRLLILYSSVLYSSIVDFIISCAVVLGHANLEKMCGLYLCKNVN
jgi:hypothetical protein